MPPFKPPRPEPPDAVRHPDHHKRHPSGWSASSSTAERPWMNMDDKPPLRERSRCVICRSRPSDGDDGWCGHCLTSYLDGWMPCELLRRVYELWGLKRPGGPHAGD